MPRGVYVRIKPVSEETKQKMSESQKGKKHCYPKDYKVPDETRKKMSESHKGRIGCMLDKHHTKESKLKMSLARMGKKQSEESKLKMSLSASGVNNSQFGKKAKNSANWKGGVTPEYLKLRMNNKSIQWRKAIFERDNYTCQKCNISGGKLNAHHIKSFTYYPELRYKVDNGITLCKDCHQNSGFHKGIQQLKVLTV